ncbi:alpha/beta hydrolase [Actinoalloteichus hymeniacidonis]|uniref:TAP-like protein n=1 Tax=Actinoalloteichus hymeniacidonis TaxID=340345 RepID=A0AAC9HN81_9PSEU|nr:alpha/beta hydrolase [Actinoalloteichus hymeniacidonis]AOS62380.1 TAP-like protein [Actinoalloteichus hymeniacidonis]MBB5909591.1 pimeloyl-ACP methyl ester carboxylesterase [Actinoalloteichus hymeniacidonis]
MDRKWTVGGGAVLVAVLGLAGTLAVLPLASGQSEEEATGQEMQWDACPEDVSDPLAQLQCATVPVPLDYSDPDGEQIDLMISKLASGNPDQRRGVLMLNPGGPGGTGLDQPNFMVSQGVPASVLNSYDLIGMDLRGVGHSAPVSCGFTNDQEYYGAIPPYAVDEAAVAEQAKVAEGIAEQCAANDTEGRLRHISTANMARDLDRIRAALGEEKGSFLGYSYGSALGAAYASMFPETTDKVVLDSNIGDTHLDQEGLRRYAHGMEETFPDFAEWAAARHDSYGLGSTPEEVRDNYFSIAERLDETPQAGLNGHLFRLSIFAALYNERSYGQTAQIWQSLLDPDGQAAGGQAVESVPEADNSELSPTDNTWSVFLAVTCNDVEWPEDVETYQQAVAEDREEYPLFGAASANISPCAFWQEPLEPPVEINTDGPANVLVVQNQRDPVTPLRGGELINEKFGDRSRLVSIDGSGHGGYVLGTNPCALNVTTSFLVDGTMPEQDVTCEAAG